MANEIRLIDANALKRAIRAESWVKNLMVRLTLDYIDIIIDEAPTVDAVEVVRCKDCRWARQKDIREPVETPRELICECFLHHHIPAPWGARLAVNPDDFCPYGERRTDNGN